MLLCGKCECFIMQMLYVCVLCASCGSSQCCVLHDLQFINAGRGWKRCLLCSSEEILPRLTRRTLAQLRTNKSPFLKSYLHKVDAKTHPSPLCPLCNIHTHDTHHLFNCTHIRTTLSPLDLWTDPAGVTALLARWTGELAGGPQAGTSDSPPPPPLAWVMGVGRQQQALFMFLYDSQSLAQSGLTTGTLQLKRCVSIFVNYGNNIYFLVLYLTPNSFIPHIISLKSRCTKLLDLIVAGSYSCWILSMFYLILHGELIERFYYVYTEL